MSDSSGRRRPPRSTPVTEREPAYTRHSVSVDRGFAILERFSGQRDSESIADIAESVDLPRSSVHRYLQTLAALGLVEQRGTPRRRYRLTASAGNPGIAAIATTGLREAAHEELVALRRASSCTARLAIRVSLDALLVDQAVSFAPEQGMLALDSRPGTRLGGSSTALGMALLASLDLDALPAELRDQGQSAHKALKGVRDRGVAITRTEPDQHAVAVPVFPPGGGEAIAAIDLIGAAPERSLALLEGHVSDLQAAAGRLAPALAQLAWVQWQPYKGRQNR